MCRNLVIKNNKLHPDMVTKQACIAAGFPYYQLFLRKIAARTTTLNFNNAEVELLPPSSEYYAKLINDVWYWVSECRECDGSPGAFRKGKNVRLIHSKLHPNMETLTLRDGRQAFRTKSGHAAPLDSSNAELLLKRPRQQLYAELINGVWYWVNGCEECNGYDRAEASWRGYACAEHDRCAYCIREFYEPSEGLFRMNGRYGWPCDACDNYKKPHWHD